MAATSTFSVPVQNRFEILNEREMEVQNFSRPSDVSRQDFVSSSIDNKLILMFDELKFIRNEQISCSAGMVTFQRSLSQVNDKVGQVLNVTNSQTALLRTIAYKSIDIEARSRRNNLIIRGITENRGENCRIIISEFLENRLDLYNTDVYITRAHRLGGRTQGRNFNKRPIIVNFRDFGDVELIMSRVYRLKDVPGISVDYDFPKEIQEARSRLWPKYKQCRAQFPNSKVSLVYPAKLIRDGRVVHDEFPDWNFYMRANRLQNIDFIGNKNNHQVRGQPNHGETIGQQLSGSNALDNTGGQVWTNNQFPPPLPYMNPPTVPVNNYPPPEISGNSTSTQSQHVFPNSHNGSCYPTLDGFPTMNANPPANVSTPMLVNYNPPRMNDCPQVVQVNIPPVLSSYTSTTNSEQPGMSDQQVTANFFSSKTTETANAISMKTSLPQQISAVTSDSGLHNILPQPPVSITTVNTPLSETAVLASSCSNTVNSEELYINETLTMMPNSIIPIVTESSTSMIDVSSKCTDVTSQTETQTQNEIHTSNTSTVKHKGVAHISRANNRSTQRAASASPYSHISSSRDRNSPVSINRKADTTGSHVSTEVNK